MNDLNIGDQIELNDEKYTILFFHKNYGNSEIFARLIGESGEKMDVPKRILLERLEYATKQNNRDVQTPLAVGRNEVHETKKYNKQNKSLKHDN